MLHMNTPASMFSSRKANTLAVLLLFAVAAVSGGPVRSGAAALPRESWTGTSVSNVATVVDQRIRRVKSSKSNGTDEDRNDSGLVPSAQDHERRDDEPRDAVTATATGLTMKLGGVKPLDMEGREIWEDVTRDFIEADIVSLTKELDDLEVSVDFVSQNPPYKPDSRQLATSGVRGTHNTRTLFGTRENAVEITFNVVVDIASEVEDPNANRYVAHAFRSDATKVAYMRRLLATNYDAFLYIGSITVDAKLAPDEKEKGAMEIGAIVGFAIMGLTLVVMGVVFLVLLRRRRTITDDSSMEVVDDKDHESAKHTRTDTASVSSEDDVVLNKFNRYRATADEYSLASKADEVSLASRYYDGNISVAWSMDTDFPTTPRVDNSKTMLGRMSRESSIDSLVVDTQLDGMELTTPVISPSVHGAPLAVSPLLKDAPSPRKVKLAARKKVKELYEI